MSGKMKNGFRKTAGILAAAVFVGAAVFVMYKFASTALDRVFPPESAASAAAPSSEAASSEALLSAGSAQADAVSSGSGAAVSGIFGVYEDAARQKLASMTLQQKVGQVLLLESPASGAVHTIDEIQPGGYCLMERDFKGKTAAQVKKTLQSYQSSSKIPMILSCDEEGGTVVRVSSNPALSPQKFQSPQQVFAKGGLDAVTADTLKKAQLLKSLGVNVNLAPVCDVSTNPKDFIYARSFGRDAQQTSQFVTASVLAYTKGGIGSVLKHFPGYAENADTHTGVSHDTRSFQAFQKSDFLPFEAGIKAGAACVMVSHNVVESMDAQHPASLSPQVHDILRTKLGFSGVIVTDSLSMKGVTAYTNGKDPCVQAFLAGNDMLLTSDGPSGYQALLAAVQKGTVPEKRLDESVLRVLAWKMSLGLLPAT